MQQTLASVTTETDRQNKALHASTNELYALETRLGEIQTRISQKALKEARVGEMVREISELAETLKVTCIFTGARCVRVDSCIVFEGLGCEDRQCRAGD